MGSGPAAGAEPGSRQGEWGAVRSWAHLGSRPHLLVQAVPVQRVRGPRENCRTEAGLSRAGRTPRPRGAQPQSPASPTAPHGPGFCSLTAAPRPPPHPEAAEGSRPVHGPAVSQQLRDGTSSLSQPRGLPWSGLGCGRPGLPPGATAPCPCWRPPHRPCTSCPRPLGAQSKNAPPRFLRPDASHFSPRGGQLNPAVPGLPPGQGWWWEGLPSPCAPPPGPGGSARSWTWVPTESHSVRPLLLLHLPSSRTGTQRPSHSHAGCPLGWAWSDPPLERTSQTLAVLPLGTSSGGWAGMSVSPAPCTPGVTGGLLQGRSVSQTRARGPRAPTVRGEQRTRGGGESRHRAGRTLPNISCKQEGPADSALPVALPSRDSMAGWLLA